MTHARPTPTAIPDIRPISDLRTHLPEIEQAARESGEPIVLTRNGQPSLLLFNVEAYNAQVGRERHIRKLREAEIEARYRADACSLQDSKDRLAAIKNMVEAMNA